MGKGLHGGGIWGQAELNPARRSFTAVTDADLSSLVAIADGLCEELRERHSSWLGDPLAWCLAQGAARHRVRGDRGVKDFDVWMFFARPSDAAGTFPLSRPVWHRDFGPSEHHRQAYTEDELARPRFAQQGVGAFQGRRVDLMVRCIPRGLTAQQSVTTWLDRGSRMVQGRSGRRMPSEFYIARAPVVCLWPELGSVWWLGPDEDEAATLRPS